MARGRAQSGWAQLQARLHEAVGPVQGTPMYLPCKAVMLLIKRRALLFIIIN